MYKILNELTGIEPQLPAVVDDQNEEGQDQSQDIEIFRIPDSGDEDDQGSCGCMDSEDDPVEDLVDRFRDWLKQNIDVETDGNELGPDDETLDGDEPDNVGTDLDPDDETVDDLEVEREPDDAVENEEPIESLGPTDDAELPEDPDAELDGGELGTGPDELEHPNKQGMIRTVKGAHLVYKRKTPDGFYEELWMFNIGKDTQRDEMEIRKDILSGTDIPPESTKSKDGTQSYELWTAGNGQMLKIGGLPN